jgi:hypothetical protein
VVGMMCGQCKHYPVGDHLWDYCGFPIPTLPVSMEVKTLVTKRDMDRECSCFEPRPDDRQLPLPHVTCTKAAPNPKAATHEGGRNVGATTERGCAVEIYLCEDCGAQWTSVE